MLCSSSGWSPKPLVSVLDRSGSKVATVGEPEVAVGPDGLFSVGVRVSVEAVEGNSARQNQSGCAASLLSKPCCYRALCHLQEQETRAWSVAWRSPIGSSAGSRGSPSQVNTPQPLARSRLLATAEILEADWSESGPVMLLPFLL